MTHSSYPPNAPAAHRPDHPRSHDDPLRPPPASELLMWIDPNVSRLSASASRDLMHLRERARAAGTPGVLIYTDAQISAMWNHRPLPATQARMRQFATLKIWRERDVGGVRHIELNRVIEPPYQGDPRLHDGWDLPTPLMSRPAPPEGEGAASNGHKRGRPRKWQIAATGAEETAYSRACQKCEDAGQPDPDRDEWVLARRAAAERGEDVSKFDAENRNINGEFPYTQSGKEIPRAPDSAAADSLQSHNEIQNLLLTAESESAANFLTPDFLTAEAARIFTPEQILAERQALIAAGVNADLARELVAGFGVARCARYRAWLPFYDGVERPGGFLADAIRAGNAPPQRWLDKRKRDLEQARAAERQRQKEAAAAAAVEEVERQAAQEGAFYASLDEEERRRFEEDALERLRTLNKEAYRRHQQDPENPGMMARAAIEKARAEVLREWMDREAQTDANVPTTGADTEAAPPGSGPAPAL